jgi:hypothetical protein
MQEALSLTYSPEEYDQALTIFDQDPHQTIIAYQLSQGVNFAEAETKLNSSQ